MELDLYLGERLVAHTIERDRGRKVTIEYDESIAAEYPAERPLLSCGVLTPGPVPPAGARAFLEGLLPEGRALETMAARIRDVELTLEGGPKYAKDAVALLAEYGRECAGAVRVVITHSSAPPSAPMYQALTPDDFDRLMQDLPRHPLGVDPDRDVRMSLAGAQPKLLLALIDGIWNEPVGGAASTHILKPAGAWLHSADNESLVMALARAAGLCGHATWAEDLGGVRTLVTERYDRIVSGDQVERLHQEDMCQATGVLPTAKYEIGRPSQRMVRILTEFADSPAVAREQLFRQVAFRAIVGDADGHGKNYSLMLDDGVVSMAPLYDSLCTLVYPEITVRMGMPIGSQVSLLRVDRSALIDEAFAMRISRSAAEDALDELATKLGDALQSVEDSLVSGWPADMVTDIIAGRISRLRSGEPLGGDGSTAPPRRTLDAATRDR